MIFLSIQFFTEKMYIFFFFFLFFLCLTPFQLPNGQEIREGSPEWPSNSESRSGEWGPISGYPDLNPDPTHQKSEDLDLMIMPEAIKSNASNKIYSISALTRPFTHLVILLLLLYFFVPFGFTSFQTKTEIFDKSSKTIDILPIFFELKWSLTFTPLR